MARQFVNVSWNNAAEQYDGYQQMNKHWNPNGTAAIHNYSDESLGLSKSKAKPKRSIRERILSQEVRLSNIEDKLKDLEEEKHTIPYEDYVQLKAILDKDYARAYELLERRLDSVNKPVKDKVKHQTPREILTENKRSALKRKQIKAKTESVKHDRKSLSKVADWINRNDWAYLLICSSIVLTAAKIIL